MPSILFGTHSEHLRLSWPSSLFTKDFVEIEVDISVRDFKGHLTPWIDSSDLVTFTEQLRALYDSLTGSASFHPLDQQLNFEFTATTGGHLVLTGEARSGGPHDNRLNFSLALDQSYLVEPLRVLEMSTAGLR